MFFLFFFFKQKTAYEMRISDWSSDVCSSDLHLRPDPADQRLRRLATRDIHLVEQLCLLGELIHHLADLGRHGIDRELEREAARVVRGCIQHGNDLGGVEERKASAEQIDAHAPGAGAGMLRVERLAACSRKTPPDMSNTETR